MSLLTINAGSSSLRLALYETEGFHRQAAVSVERIGSNGTRLLMGGTEHKIEAKDHASAVDEVLRHLPELFALGLDAIGHRIVQGGADHAEPETITSRLLNELGELARLDPTHMPQSLSVIDFLMRRFPNVPQFACFDTAFHGSMPDARCCTTLSAPALDLRGGRSTVRLSRTFVRIDC
jgi:acetate kinase